MLDGWDLALFLGGAYVALTALVRLMSAHRDRVVARIHGQAVQASKQRKKKKPPRKQAA